MWYGNDTRYGSSYNLGIDKLFNSMWPNEKLTTKTYEVFEENGHLVMTIDLPGAKSGDLKVESTGNLIKIFGKQKGKDFSYEYNLSKNYDPYSGVARLEDGVLTLSFSRHEKEKPKVYQIPIA